MASPEEETERYDDEGPQARGNGTSALPGSLSSHAGTVVSSCLNLRDYLELESAPSSFKGDAHPVESMIWDEATEFCDRLSRNIRC